MYRLTVTTSPANAATLYYTHTTGWYNSRISLLTVRYGYRLSADEEFKHTCSLIHITRAFSNTTFTTTFSLHRYSILRTYDSSLQLMNKSSNDTFVGHQPIKSSSMRVYSYIYNSTRSLSAVQQHLQKRKYVHVTIRYNSRTSFLTIHFIDHRLLKEFKPTLFIYIHGHRLQQGLLQCVKATNNSLPSFQITHQAIKQFKGNG